MFSKLKTTKFIVLSILFLDVLSIWLFVPLLPDLVNYFHVSIFLISLAIWVYALFSFVFNPILGQLSDKIWRKKVLILCAIWSFFSNLIMALSNTYLVFMIWRVINWITWWNISIISSILSDISENKKERATNFWFMGALFGIWFVVGPALSVFLMQFWVKVPFYFMVAFSFIEIFLIYFFLQETNKNLSNRKLVYNPFATIFKFIKIENTRYFILSLFFLLLASSMYQGMLPVYLVDKFWVSINFAGIFMSVIWFVILLNQAVLFKKFWLKYFSIKKLIFTLNIWALILFFILSFVYKINIFIWLFIILVMFYGVIRPIYQTELIENVDKTQTWEVLWVTSSIQSLVMFLWPLIAGYLMDKNIDIFFASSLFVLVSVLFLVKLKNYLVDKN